MSTEFIEPLESRRLLAGVTILATGRLGGANGWMQSMAEAFTRRNGGSSQVPWYIVTIGPDANNNLTATKLTHVSGTPTPQTGGGEILLSIDYFNISADVSYPLTNIGDAIANFLTTSTVDGIRLAELPMHLIGVSRGSGLMDETAQALGRSGVWVDQETTLDPRPIAANGDLAPILYDNVAFSDNYWRTDGISANDAMNGQPVSGAYNLELPWVQAHHDGYTQVHLAPSGYYIGTIDFTATQGGEGPIYSDWYGTTADKPARDKTGFFYSDIVGGVRPLNGVWAASGGTGNRTATGQSGSQWADITGIAVSGGPNFSSGQALQINYLQQDRDSASAATFYLDRDRNPYNGGFAYTLGSAALNASGTIGQQQLSASTNGVSAGNYWVVSKITDAQGHVRYSYSQPISFIEQGAVYLSSLTPTASSNGWGPVEKNLSNGETGAGDGRAITLNGAVYTKGLGVHASADVTFNLNRQYSQFFSDVGIDDEVGSNGSAIFQVFVDGAKVFDSGLMSGASTTQGVSLNVSNATTLRLVVTDGGNGNSYDHGDWAARVIQSGTTPPPPPPPSTVYLSQLTATSATNGWGPYEKDLSNGETGSGDGHTLTLNGVTYARGIGVHATSDITFALNKQYTQFTSDVGLDDEVGNNGGAVFQVFVDGAKLFDSGLMTGASATQSVNLDVSSATTLRLVVPDGGNGNSFDHGDWAGAKLTTSSNPPPPPPPPSTVYLSQLTAIAATNGWGPYEKDLSNGETGTGDGHTITLNGVTYAKGLGTHAASDISFNLNKQYTQFTTDVGLDDEVGNNGSVDFQVYIDGVKLFDSGVVTGSSATQTVTLSVSGASTLRLVVTDGGNGNGFDHGDWAGAKLLV